jgi:hypothetical protein
MVWGSCTCQRNKAKRTPFQNYVLGWRLEQKQRGWAKVIDLDRTPSPMLQTHRPRFSIPFFDKTSTMEVVELLFFRWPPLLLPSQMGEEIVKRQVHASCSLLGKKIFSPVLLDKGTSAGCAATANSGLSPTQHRMCVGRR